MDKRFSADSKRNLEQDWTDERAGYKPEIMLPVTRRHDRQGEIRVC